MSKRTIQATRPGFTIGIEHDHLAIRGARLAMDGRGGFSVDRLEEVHGNFSDDDALLEGFRRLKASIRMGSKDCVSTSLSGKQVFAAQLEFRRLKADEMEQALRLEIRKNVHFEVATSTLDYAVIDETGDGSSGAPTQVLVSLAANSLLSRELHLLEKAGFPVSVVDVLPLGVANALWASRVNQVHDFPRIALHVGPQVSTIVIDGESFPFFNRSIYFAAEDIFKLAPTSITGDRRVQSFIEEIARSLTFYEKSLNIAGFQEFVLLGDFLGKDLLLDIISQSAGVPVRTMNLAGILGGPVEAPPGKFDLAISLALRGGA